MRSYGRFERIYLSACLHVMSRLNEETFGASCSNASALVLLFCCFISFISAHPRDASVHLMLQVCAQLQEIRKLSSFYSLCFFSVSLCKISHTFSLSPSFLFFSFLPISARALARAQDASVRRVSLLAVQELAKDEEHVRSMSFFLSRFVKRFVEMTEDVDDGIAALAIKLLTQLLK